MKSYDLFIESILRDEAAIKTPEIGDFVICKLDKIEMEPYDTKTIINKLGVE